MTTPKMTTIFVGEQRNGRIKFTTDRDCLSPDIIRFDERIIANPDTDLPRIAEAYERRGFRVCIDTETLFYETEVIS